MLRYTIRRILLLIPIILIVSFIVYLLMDLAPGSIVDNMITENMSQEDIAKLYEQYDMDKSVFYRYGKYMLHFVQGDMGVSDYTGVSVYKTYMRAFPRTLILALSGFFIGFIVAVPLGIFAARHSGTIWDSTATLFSMLGLSVPNFWLGIQLILLFSVKWGLLPAGGTSAGIAGLILPAISGGFSMMGTCSRTVRSSMLDVLRADYLRTARAKGVPEKNVIRKHALGNAWIPILTSFGSLLAINIAGSAVVESVFNWPGVGQLLVSSVRQRDITLTTGCVIMTSILYTVIQLLVDLAYAFVDPRIRSRFAKTLS